MKKTIPYVLMAAAILLTCILGNIETIPLVPAITPAEFLASMPYVTFNLLGKEIILIQPSSTFFVYLLGIIIIAFGIYFLRFKGEEKSRSYWGLGMILWGLGAIVAGTSYQAFGYMLKCEGYEYCRFTSYWELAYMLLTCYSINYLVAATAYTSATGKLRDYVLKYAVVHSFLYTAVMIIGAMLPSKFLISYECFLLMNMANFILMFILNLKTYLKAKDKLNFNFIILWLWFLGVNAGYFLWLFAGVSAPLYEKYGIWFNENDVLHVLLIFWMIYAFVKLRKHLKDASIENWLKCGTFPHAELSYHYYPQKFLFLRLLALSFKTNRSSINNLALLIELHFFKILF